MYRWDRKHRSGWRGHIHTQDFFWFWSLLACGAQDHGSRWSLYFCFSMWINSYIHPSITLQPKPRVTLPSLARSCTLYERCPALYAFPEVCRGRGCVWSSWLRPEGVLEWRCGIPANNRCLNVDNSHNNCCGVNLRILHTSSRASSALIHLLFSIAFSFGYFCCIILLS